MLGIVTKKDLRYIWDNLEVLRKRNSDLRECISKVCGHDKLERQGLERYKCIKCGVTLIGNVRRKNRKIYKRVATEKLVVEE